MSFMLNRDIMKLYYAKGACSLAVRIVINELNLKCIYEAVDLKTKQTEEGANFLNVNPKGAVPTLLLDNGEVLTENSIIQQYLADKNSATRLLPPINDFKRYRVLEWLNYITTELHKGAAVFFNPKVSASDKKEIFIPLLKNKYNFVNNQLGNKKFLLEHDFTLPDAYLFVMLSWLENFEIDILQWPHLSHYFSELKKRPSIEKSIREEHLEKLLTI